MARYIDADELKKELKWEVMFDYDADYQYVTKYDIDNTPTADVAEVKHGRWIEKPYEFDFGGVKTYSSVTDTVCSVCGESAIEYMETPWCPWCGAKMDEVCENESR